MDLREQENQEKYRSTTEENTGYRDSFQYENSYDIYGQPKGRTVLNGIEQTKKQKKDSPRLVLCLFYLGVALLSIGVTFLVTIGNNLISKNIIPPPSYEEVEVDNSFFLYANNEIILEDQAYTLIKSEQVIGLPKGDQLVAIYIEVESEEYVKDTYVLEDVYVGGEGEHRTPVTGDNILPYVMEMGMRKYHILHNYGIGNGISQAGYFLFLIPEEAQEITLYMQHKSGADQRGEVNTLYKKTFPLEQVSAEKMKELTNRKVTTSDENIY